MNFYPVATHEVDQRPSSRVRVSVPNLPLPQGDNPCVRGLGPSSTKGVEALFPKVLEKRIRMTGNQIQRTQHRSLLVVDVVPMGPIDFLVGWDGTKPFPAKTVRVRSCVIEDRQNRFGELTSHRAGACIAEGLMKAARRISIHRDPSHISRVPSLREVVHPNAWHTPTIHLRQLVMSQPR